MAEPMPLVDVPDDARLCEQLTARIETAMAKGMSAREIAHSVMPVVLATVLAERDAHEAIVRAKVAEEVYEADYAHRPLWADEEELAEGHFQDRDLTWWMTALGHPKAHAGCCKTCGCATTCIAGAFLDAVTATATRIARGET